ncbi:YciI family protein [Hamadaea sp. NPDC050747]|uniref:YciI family protein n=1 Tax=Hamadaea sp. NPDC050747 TaxID=3155789 RepID=UPI0033FB4CE4
MAKYLILIHGDEQAWENATPAEFDAMMTAHNAFAAKHGPAILGGEALQSTKTATTIRTDGTITDGPFAEIKEALGGYYLIQAADLDEAIAVAKDCPMPDGGVEVRPIMEFE